MKLMESALFAMCAAVAAPVALTGCGGDAKGLDSYAAMPGAGLPLGGEWLMEKVYYSPSIVMSDTYALVNQFHAYKFDGQMDAPSPDKSPPIDNVEQACVKITNPADYFPVEDLPQDIDYKDWGDSITLNGPGMGSGVDVAKLVVTGEGDVTDNRPSPTRHHKVGAILYGGPTWQGDNFQSQTIMPDVDYTLSVNNDDGDPIKVHFPREYDFPLGGGKNDVTIPKTAPAGGFEVTWESLLNDDNTRDPEDDFAFIAFAALPEAGDLGPSPLYICVPPIGEDGTFTMSQEMLDDLPDVGVFQAGRLTHWMDVVDGARFDEFGIWCSISLYMKTDG